MDGTHVIVLCLVCWCLLTAFVSVCLESSQACGYLTPTLASTPPYPLPSNIIPPPPTLSLATLSPLTSSNPPLA